MRLMPQNHLHATPRRLGPMASLVFSVYSGKGVYALLAGFGRGRLRFLSVGRSRSISSVRSQECREMSADQIRSNGI